MKWLILVCCTFPLVTFSQAPLPPSHNRLIVIAHRGDHVKAPENTLASIENAITSGADYVELDLRTTKDGKLVILHDATVDRMTDGTGLVDHLTFEEIRKLKVQNKSHPEFGISFIPSFEEALQAMGTKINLYLDFKNADVSVAWDQLQRSHMEKSVVVYINSLEQYRQWRKVAPSIPVMISLPESIKDGTALARFLSDMDAEILDGSYQQYTWDIVRVAESKGRVVWADIQQQAEGPELWDNALKVQLHGLQTDHPAELIRYLMERKIR
jgi:glycerophosphoryl diester phosphodiesterase